MQAIRKGCKIIFLSLIVFILVISSINVYVYLSTRQQVNSHEDFEADCILILGAGVRNNQPSPMLNDRLLQGIELYKQKKAPKIIMSGDHGKDSYDEVNVMKRFAIEQDVPSSDIFMDHAGFSTYESIYRAKEIFQAKKIIIVTQEYHLYRALYIADRLGLDAYGVLADTKQYSGQVYRNVREILARVKDFCYTIFQPKPTYLGETIPVSGNGDLTNDK